MPTDPVRDEAERLAAAAIAAASLAARSLGRGRWGGWAHGWSDTDASAGSGSTVGSDSTAESTLGSDPTAGGFATGSAECCICPVCRVIAAMRDPSAEMTDRLVAGAGDLATAVANLLRTLAQPSGDAEGDAGRARATRDADASGSWRAATAPTSTPPAAGAPTTPPPAAASTSTPPKPMAKKAVKKAAAKSATQPSKRPPRPARPAEAG